MSRYNGTGYTGSALKDETAPDLPNPLVYQTRKGGFMTDRLPEGEGGPADVVNPSVPEPSQRGPLDEPTERPEERDSLNEAHVWLEAIAYEPSTQKLASSKHARTLINEVKDLREENHRLDVQAKSRGAQLFAEQEHGKQMEEALRFYAPRKNYDWQFYFDADGNRATKTTSLVSEDGGRIARAALSPSDTEEGA